MAYGYGYQQPGVYGAGYYGPGQAMPDQLAQLRAAPMQAQQPMQTVQPMQQAPQQVGSSVIWVQGEAGAKSYLVAAGNSVLLMDSEAQTFYLKSTDQSGMPSMRTFDYQERVQAKAQPAVAEVHSPAYMTRDEVDAMITAKLEALIAKPAKGATKKEAANESTV